MAEFANDRIGHLPRSSEASQYNFRRMDSNQHENALILARRPAKHAKRPERPSNGFQAHSCCPDDLSHSGVGAPNDGRQMIAASPTKARMVNMAAMNRSVHVSCFAIKQQRRMRFSVRVGICLEDGGGLQ
jgi:hypothetical protein